MAHLNGSIESAYPKDYVDGHNPDQKGHAVQNICDIERPQATENDGLHILCGWPWRGESTVNAGVPCNPDLEPRALST